jgi:hypothetical protein
MPSIRKNRSVESMVESAHERAASTERTVAASMQQAERTYSTMEETAQTLESAVEEGAGQHDPAIVQKVMDLVSYLRAPAPPANPLIDLFTRAPAHSGTSRKE